MGGNGVGDVSIYGYINPIEYLGPQLKAYSNTGYYCCNGCAFKPTSTCEFNDIIGITIDERDQLSVFTKLVNPHQLPLISIRNEFIGYLIQMKGYAQPSF